MIKHLLISIIALVLLASCSEKTVTPSSISSFPQFKAPPNAFMEAIIKGKLKVINGCIRVDDGKGSDYLLIWHPRFSLNENQIIDENGKVAASIGDFVEVSGGEGYTPLNSQLVEPLPQNCSSPYWFVGESVRKIDKP